MENGFKQSIVEALILASPEPLPGRKIADMVEDMTPSKVSQAVAELNNRYMQGGASYRIRELAGGYQFYILSEFSGFVQDLFARRRKLRLTRAALETLAIVAYKQPVSKTDIEQIRGVASDGVLHNLLEKDLIAIKGRANTVGKPLQYGTTDEFLKFFGLNRLEDLPKMSEIEQLVSMPESRSQTELLLAADDGIGEENVKLNIADGTYQPDDQDRDEHSPDDPADDRGGDDTDDDPENDHPQDKATSSERADSVSGGIIVDLDTT